MHALQMQPAVLESPADGDNQPTQRLLHMRGLISGFRYSQSCSISLSFKPQIPCFNFPPSEHLDVMEATDKPDYVDEGIILVLGSTGSGKSYLLNQLKEGSAKEGHTLSSGKFTTGSVASAHRLTGFQRHLIVPLFRYFSMRGRNEASPSLTRPALTTRRSALGKSSPTSPSSSRDSTAWACRSEACSSCTGYPTTA